MQFEELIGKRALGMAVSSDYTSGAEGLLSDNIESENCAILASFSLERDPDSEEIESYFQYCVKDLGLDLPPDNVTIANYAKSICRQVVDDVFPPREGLAILETLYAESKYNELLYSIWDELAEDIALIEDDWGALYNSSITKENIGKYIVDVAKQYLILCEIELPENFFYLHACKHCGHIGESGTERLDKPWMPVKIFRLLHRRGPSSRAICGQCKHPYPRRMDDYEAREQYLKTYR